MTSKTEI